jgi:hypothetical protein
MRGVPVTKVNDEIKSVHVSVWNKDARGYVDQKYKAEVVTERGRVERGYGQTKARSEADARRKLK